MQIGRTPLVERFTSRSSAITVLKHHGTHQIMTCCDRSLRKSTTYAGDPVERYGQPDINHARITIP